MSTHTLGPWSDTLGTIKSEVRTADGTRLYPLIAIVAQCTTSAEANAALIARAPDLLAENEALRAQVKALMKAAERIANHETRADRRHRGMVDMAELDDLRRIARIAIRAAEGGE
jgi:hypothetical protein